MALLEREPQLQALREAFALAAAGEGRVALVAGESGIGKTSLLEAFTAAPPAPARVLWGACDALFTPRPLGPLYDIAAQSLPNLLAQLNAERDHRAIFAAFLAELQQSPLPSLVVFEDVHWADEATLDLIKFLGRRIRRTAALLILTYRDDEAGPQRPLHVVLGDLLGAGILHLSLPPLSETAVVALAQQYHRPFQGLHSLTGGNPFFVTEMLAKEAAGVPAGVREAVLARAARLSPPARKVLDPVSIVPGAFEVWLLEAVLHPPAAALDECVERGILYAEAGTLAFRHELARRAVEAALPAARARELHASILRSLIEHGADRVGMPRLVHHAVQAGDGEAILRYAPAAARQAGALGAHREAAAHYRVALEHARLLSAPEHAELLDQYAQEAELSEQVAEAGQALREALRLWRDLGRRDREGRAWRRLSEVAIKLNRYEEVNYCADQAIATLEALPPSKELAMAYSHKSRLHMVAKRASETVQWGSRAIELAERLGDVATLVHALNNLGSVEMVMPGRSREGRAKVVRSLQLALAVGLQNDAARAYFNLAAPISPQHYAASLEYANEGIAHCIQHALDYWRLGLLGWRARIQLERGHWAEAEQDIQTAQEFWGGLETRAEVEPVLVLLRVRRGASVTPDALEAMREIATETIMLHNALNISALFAEAAWLNGDLARCRAEAEPLFQIACQRSLEKNIGELARWLWRAGTLARPPANAAEPYATQIRGDWRAAAAMWQEFGCPYEQALALMDGDEAAQREALALLEGLGAAPAAALVREKLRAAGARHIPRGPRAATRENPAGLTARQMEILALLAEGLSNAQIAARLHISPRTAGHHVSAVLARLDAPTRQAAAQVAAERGLLP